MLFFYLPDSDLTGFYTAGKAEWAPYGDWGRAGDVPTGDYSKHELRVTVGTAVGVDAKKPPRESASSPTRVGYRLTGRDIKGVPIPSEAQLVVEDRAPTALGINQEVYSVPWTSDRIISFFDANMPRERFVKQTCVEFEGVPSCVYLRGNQLISVEYENGRFTLTEVMQ
jgi:hypothetical protein